jgi:hypothetical protein
LSFTPKGIREALLKIAAAGDVSCFKCRAIRQ